MTPLRRWLTRREGVLLLRAHDGGAVREYPVPGVEVSGRWSKLAAACSGAERVEALGAGGVVVGVWERRGPESRPEACAAPAPVTAAPAASPAPVEAFGMLMQAFRMQGEVLRESMTLTRVVLGEYKALATMALESSKVEAESPGAAAAEAAVEAAAAGGDPMDAAFSKLVDAVAPHVAARVAAGMNGAGGAGK